MNWAIKRGCFTEYLRVWGVDIMDSYSAFNTSKGKSSWFVHFVFENSNTAMLNFRKTQRTFRQRHLSHKDTKPQSHQCKVEQNHQQGQEIAQILLRIWTTIFKFLHPCEDQQQINGKPGHCHAKISWFWNTAHFYKKCQAQNVKDLYKYKDYYLPGVSEEILSF